MLLKDNSLSRIQRIEPKGTQFKAKDPMDFILMGSYEG
jgi:hypothetical protein